MSYLPRSATESIYIAIAERRPNPAHAHLSAPSSFSEILGVFRTADEAKQRVRAEVGDDLAKLTEWVHGERGVNTWVETLQGCLRIFDVVLEGGMLLNARVERHELGTLPAVATETAEVVGSKRRRTDTALPLAPVPIPTPAPAPSSYTVYLRLMKWEGATYCALDERKQTFLTPEEADACALSLGAEYGFKKDDFDRHRLGHTKGLLELSGRCLLCSEYMSLICICSDAWLWIDTTKGPHPLPKTLRVYVVTYKLISWKGKVKKKRKFTFPTAAEANEKAVEIADKYRICEDDFIDYLGGLLALDNRKCAEGFLVIDVEKSIPRVPPPGLGAP